MTRVIPEGLASNLGSTRQFYVFSVSYVATKLEVNNQDGQRTLGVLMMRSGAKNGHDGYTLL